MKVGDAVYTRGGGGEIWRVMGFKFPGVLIGRPPFGNPTRVNHTSLITVANAKCLMACGKEAQVGAFLATPEVLADILAQEHDEALERVLEDATYCANWESP